MTWTRTWTRSSLWASEFQIGSLFFFYYLKTWRWKKLEEIINLMPFNILPKNQGNFKAFHWYFFPLFFVFFFWPGQDTMPVGLWGCGAVGGEAPGCQDPRWNCQTKAQGEAVGYWLRYSRYSWYSIPEPNDLSSGTKSLRKSLRKSQFPSQSAPKLAPLLRLQLAPFVTGPYRVLLSVLNQKGSPFWQGWQGRELQTTKKIKKSK